MAYRGELYGQVFIAETEDEVEEMVLDYIEEQGINGDEFITMVIEQID